MKPDAVISVRFKTLEEGGRATAVDGQFYSCPLIVDGEAFDCRLILKGKKIELGVSADVSVKFLFRQSALAKLKLGEEIVLWEGKDVAVGRVKEIFL